ncbi:MAG: guanine deaminase [Hyphomicrobiales bacterium]|nr:guanine deaminase [Hyphomicrobiales bacterium]
MTGNSERFALRGPTLAFKADPLAIAVGGGDPADALAFDSDGAVVIDGGRIIAAGTASTVLSAEPSLPVVTYGSAHLITAGFVDAHAHYPQTRIIASYGKQLIDWLNTYTFPAELAFADPERASADAELYLDECLRNGITTASVYCTVHEVSADAFFAAAARRGLRMAAGKVLMDRNAPAGLTDTAQSGYDASARLIDRWHGKDRLHYVISPRFAPTSTPEQLEAAGALWRANPGTLMQTHMSESRDEIAWVARLFPDAPDYLGVYERHGLAGPGANFGHCIHLSPREQARLGETGSGISHCPTSNLFIGSGLFDLAGLAAGGHPRSPIGLATDVGGGSSFSMFATMRAAYEIAQLRGVSLHPATAWHLATLGSARVLRLDDRIGNLAAGYDADIVVLDLQSRPLLAARMAQARSIADVLFAQMILADDRAIHAVYVGGRRVPLRA